MTANIKVKWALNFGASVVKSEYDEHIVMLALETWKHDISSQLPIVKCIILAFCLDSFIVQEAWRVFLGCNSLNCTTKNIGYLPTIASLGFIVRPSPVYLWGWQTVTNSLFGREKDDDNDDSGGEFDECHFLC